MQRPRPVAPSFVSQADKLLLQLRLFNGVLGKKTKNGPAAATLSTAWPRCHRGVLFGSGPKEKVSRLCGVPDQFRSEE